MVYIQFLFNRDMLMYKCKTTQVHNKQWQVYSLSLNDKRYHK